jgi:hypothetical protein
MTAWPAFSAPVTIASACSRVMTLNAATAWRRVAAAATISPVGISGMVEFSSMRVAGGGDFGSGDGDGCA